MVSAHAAGSRERKAPWRLRVNLNGTHQEEEWPMDSVDAPRHATSLGFYPVRPSRRWCRHEVTPNRHCSRQAKLRIAAAAGGLILVAVLRPRRLLLNRLQLNAIR